MEDNYNGFTIEDGDEDLVGLNLWNEDDDDEDDEDDED